MDGPPDIETELKIEVAYLKGRREQLFEELMGIDQVMRRVHYMPRDISTLDKAKAAIDELLELRKLDQARKTTVISLIISKVKLFFAKLGFCERIRLGDQVLDGDKLREANLDEVGWKVLGTTVYRRRF